MAGRGRGSTLPAWMTNPDSLGPEPTITSSSNASDQFSDARHDDDEVPSSVGAGRGRGRGGVPVLPDGKIFSV